MHRVQHLALLFDHSDEVILLNITAIDRSSSNGRVSLGTVALVVVRVEYLIMASASKRCCRLTFSDLHRSMRGVRLLLMVMLQEVLKLLVSEVEVCDLRTHRVQVS